MYCNWQTVGAAAEGVGGATGTDWNQEGRGSEGSQQGEYGVR